jgi:DNA-binding LacI/PurR family transcriptional regulator
MPVTLTDVAQVAGVSIATASRVLSQSEHPVNIRTRQRILQVADELGYRPNLIARSLRLERTYTLGVVIENVAEFFSSLILRGILDYFASSTYSIIILNTDYDEETEIEAIKHLIRRSAEGVIFIDTALHSVQKMDSSQTIPSVFVNRRYQVSEEHCIITDNRMNARIATEHLVNLGHLRIAYIGGPAGWEATTERHTGYCDILSQYSLPYLPNLVSEGDWQLASGYQATQRFLRLNDPPTAIFATNDKMAMGAIYAVQDAGKKVPEDVAVVGFDNRTFTDLIRPAMTTVSLPGYEMGKTAAKMMMDQMRGQEMACSIVPICGELIVRESCGAHLRRWE